ncbi:MAG TPA: hypothetical protein PLO67_23405, partial [Saprospiraceae bacterium]|nr:hypothetical protein [Saprospiraceae bacterium]HPI09272.1 hypothetical protein [Saprospiraceae bacterium]
KPPESVLSALNLSFFNHIAAENQHKNQEKCEYKHRINFFLVEQMCVYRLHYKNEASPILVFPK